MEEREKFIVKSSFYNQLFIIINLFLGILNTFLIARLLSPTEWSVIIFIVSLIPLITFFCQIVPPAVEITTQYYIPKIRTNEKNSGEIIRRFLIHAFKIRFVFTILIYIISIIILKFIYLDPIYFQTFLIMSPLILMNVSQNLINSILLAFKKFKRIFILNMIYIVILINFNLIFFFLDLKNNPKLIAYSYLFSSLGTFIISIIFTVPLIPKKQKRTIDKSEIKKEFIKLHKEYGFFLSLSVFFVRISYFLPNLIFLRFDVLVYITYFSICQNIAFQAFAFSSSNEGAMVSIFSEFNFKDKLELRSFKKLFSNFIKYNEIYTCFIIGMFFFFMEIYINAIYSSTYIIITIPAQICIFTAFTRMLTRNFLTIAKSTNKTKDLAIYELIRLILIILGVIFGLIFFDFIGLIVIFLLISFSLNFFSIFLINRAIALKLKIYNVYKPFLIFLISFFISFFSSLFINFEFLPNHIINLIFNDLIIVIIFFSLYLILIHITKLITQDEIEYIIGIIPLLNSNSKFLQYITRKFIKLFPSRRRKNF